MTATPQETREGPLTGVRVLDLSRVLAGPFCSMIMADLGAEVIKVEEIGKGDQPRPIPPFKGGESHYFLAINRGKKSVVIDLKTPEGLQLAKDLAAKCDIVVENYRPGVMDKLGVGYEALREVQPGLIWCAITGFGQTGPLRDRPGHDIDFVALSGIASHMGRPGQGPSQPGVLVGDVGGGTYPALVGLLAAAAGPALAQYPGTSSISLVIPYPPGGIGDYLARLVAKVRATSRSVAGVNRSGWGIGDISSLSSVWHFLLEPAVQSPSGGRQAH